MIELVQADTTTNEQELNSLQKLQEACGENPGSVCRQIFEWTGNSFLADALQWLIGRPLRIIIILIATFIVGRVIKRLIRRAVARLSERTSSANLQKLRQKGPGRHIFSSEDESQRAEERAATIGSVLSSVTTATVWGISILMVLGQLGINIAPLLASAGIVGVALGFGSQTIVRDFLSGVFMVVEDQFGVGDIVNVGDITGTVEKVSLRTTTLRDNTGTVWHVPNGEITRVGNLSQLWSKALLNVEVSYDTDLRFAEGVIQRVANEMWEDPEWGGDELMESPEVAGIQTLGADGIAIRLSVKTSPAMQWAVERELRLRIKEAFDEAGIEIPFPQRTIWLRNEGDRPPVGKPDPNTIPIAEIPRYVTGHKPDLEEAEDNEDEEENGEAETK